MDRVIGNYDFCACGTPIKLGQTLCDKCRRAGKKKVAGGMMDDERLIETEVDDWRFKVDHGALRCESKDEWGYLSPDDDAPKGAAEALVSSHAEQAKRIAVLEKRVAENTDPDEDEARLREHVREIQRAMVEYRGPGPQKIQPWAAYCDTLLARIDAQAERIKALEATIEIPRVIDANMVNARQETATEIAREAREVSSMWYGRQVALPDLEAICRKHGATV